MQLFSADPTMFLFYFAHENMKKPASKVAKTAQIQPKSQFLFHKNLPPRDFSLMESLAYLLWNIILILTYLFKQSLHGTAPTSRTTNVRLSPILSKFFGAVIPIPTVGVFKVNRPRPILTAIIRSAIRRHKEANIKVYG